jgi:hypothetical protein
VPKLLQGCRICRKLKAGCFSGVIGGIVVFVTAPLTIAIVGFAAIGATAVEGGCVLVDERITDFDEILALLTDVSKSMTFEHFQLHVPLRGEMSLADYEVHKTAAFINVLNESGEFDRYQVSKGHLYKLPHPPHCGKVKQ